MTRCTKEVLMISVLLFYTRTKRKKKKKEIREFCFLEKVKFYLYENSIIKTKKLFCNLEVASWCIIIQNFQSFTINAKNG